jgi:DNA-binding transcriptional ArsR family regulator
MDIWIVVKPNATPALRTRLLPYFYDSRNTVDNRESISEYAAMKLDDAAAHLEALGNPTRLKIYRALVRAGDAGLAVGRLQDKLKIAPSTLSHHIKTLMVVGLVNQVRDATTLVCHANYDVMRSLVNFLVAECCTETAEGEDNKAA